LCVKTSAATHSNNWLVFLVMYIFRFLVHVYKACTLLCQWFVASILVRSCVYTDDQFYFIVKLAGSDKQ